LVAFQREDAIGVPFDNLLREVALASSFAAIDFLSAVRHLLCTSPAGVWMLGCSIRQRAATERCAVLRLQHRPRNPPVVWRLHGDDLARTGNNDAR